MIVISTFGAIIIGACDLIGGVYLGYRTSQLHDKLTEQEKDDEKTQYEN